MANNPCLGNANPLFWSQWADECSSQITNPKTILKIRQWTGIWNKAKKSSARFKPISISQHMVCSIVLLSSFPSLQWLFCCEAHLPLKIYLSITVFLAWSHWILIHPWMVSVWRIRWRALHEIQMHPLLLLCASWSQIIEWKHGRNPECCTVTSTVRWKKGKKKK